MNTFSAPPHWTSALKVAVFSSILFLVLYSGTAILTEMRYQEIPDSVGTWYYEWERIIPLVPIMIVPYMSIDLFFFLAPFVCSDKRELRVLAQRLTAVVVIAAACFLIYPLRLAVDRPEVSGFFGGIYNWFTSMDRPYNLCPSMHIALRTVLAAHFGKHSQGVVRVAMNVWFFLIGCSTLLLYQHHVIDVVGGFVLALLVMYAMDGLPWKQTKCGGQHFAILYALLATALALPTFWFPLLGWSFWWPALACSLVAWGYAWAGPAVYRRHFGQVSWPAKFVLGPVLVAQWLSWKYYRSQSNPMDSVEDGVWIGRHLTLVEAQQATKETIGAVIDVCNAFDEPAPLRSVKRLELPILDLTAPSESQVNQAVEFIEKHRGQGVLVHCKAGYSRSAAIVAAWLVRTGRAENAEAAFRKLKAVRPNIVIRPEIQSMKFS